ncbi:MAG: hypothetical protein IPG81_29160 [Sandaracinaceae bacterium]|nr:hypothetical protein [Sandaracinaceae bacterium]
MPSRHRGFRAAAARHHARGATSIDLFGHDFNTFRWRRFYASRRGAWFGPATITATNYLVSPQSEGRIGDDVNPNLLIDAIVHQTMVLIGQLATSAGIRAPLSHVADQVFLELVRELESQGVRQKVVADMFGMALRTYQKKVQRLSQSATDRGRTLGRRSTTSSSSAASPRARTFCNASHDEDSTVRGILRDMVANGLVFESGTGLRIACRAATDEDLDLLGKDEDGDEAATFVWAAICRLGPITIGELQDAIHMDRARLQRLVDQLATDGRVQSEETTASLSSSLVPGEAAPAALVTVRRASSRPTRRSSWLGRGCVRPLPSGRPHDPRQARGRRPRGSLPGPGRWQHMVI